MEQDIKAEKEGRNRRQSARIAKRQKREVQLPMQQALPAPFVPSTSTSAPMSQEPMNLAEMEYFLDETPLSSGSAPEFFPVVVQAQPAENVGDAEKTFMKEQLKTLEGAMVKLKEYFLLIPVNVQETEIIRASDVKTPGALSVNAGSTIFYNQHSSDFLQFARFWHFANRFYAQIPLDEALPRFGSREHENFEQIATAGITNNGLMQIGRKKLIATTIEQASYVAEQKTREVYGLYKLIVNNRANTKAEAAKMVEATGMYPAKRILIWADEYYRNNGHFLRY